MGIFSGIYALLGNLNFISGNSEKARAFYKKAIDGKTKKSVAYLNYSIMLLRDGNWSEALVLLETGISMKHNVINDKNIRLTMASCYWVGGNIDKAIEVLEELRRKYAYINSSALTTLGYMYFLKQDYEKAVYFSEIAIEDNPQSGPAWDNIGQIRFVQNDIANAKEAFEKAISFNAYLPDSLYYLGIISEKEDDKDSAYKYFDRARQCTISSLNTVTMEQVALKCAQYTENT